MRTATPTIAYPQNWPLVEKQTQLFNKGWLNKETNPPWPLGSWRDSPRSHSLALPSQPLLQRRLKVLENKN
jgi:hypothetical protein